MRLAILGLLLSGCLIFEEQVVEVRYSAKADRLELHILYFGLHNDGASGEGTEQLTKAVDDDEVCLVDWPFHYQPTRVSKADDPVARFLVRHAKVRRIGFFKDARGRLSGGQIVIIERVRELFRIVNMALTKEVLPDVVDHVDRETRALNEAAAKAGHQWLRMRGNAIEFEFFVSDRDFERMKREGLRELFGVEGKNRSMIMEFLARNTISMVREGKSVRFVLGNAKGRTRLVTPAQGRDPYTPNLVAHVEAHWGFQFDAAIAPLLVTEPKRLPFERVQALVEQLGGRNPRRAAETLAGAEGNVEDIERLAAAGSPDARRRAREVAAKLKRRVSNRRFAASLPRSERVRLLLTMRDDERAVTRLRTEMASLPEPPSDEPGDVVKFWDEWLKESRAGGK